MDFDQLDFNIKPTEDEITSNQFELNLDKSENAVSDVPDILELDFNNSQKIKQTNTYSMPKLDGSFNLNNKRDNTNDENSKNIDNSHDPFDSNLFSSNVNSPMSELNQKSLNSNNLVTHSPKSPTNSDFIRTFSSSDELTYDKQTTIQPNSHSIDDQALDQQLQRKADDIYNKLIDDLRKEMVILQQDAINKDQEEINQVQNTLDINNSNNKQCLNENEKLNHLLDVYQSVKKIISDNPRNNNNAILLANGEEFAQLFKKKIAVLNRK